MPPQIKQVKLETLEAIIKEVEGMKYEDPRVEGHAPHPAKEWTECPACTENYHHNSALDRVLTKLQAELTLLKNET